MQLLLKLAIILALFVFLFVLPRWPALYARITFAAKVLGFFLFAWYLLVSTVNIEGLPRYVGDQLRPKDDRLVRELDSLYQGGKPVARVEGVTIDNHDRVIHFERIMGNIDLLNAGAEPIFYGPHRLGRNFHIESITGSPPSPYLYKSVTYPIARYPFC